MGTRTRGHVPLTQPGGARRGTRDAGRETRDARRGHAHTQTAEKDEAHVRASFVRQGGGPLPIFPDGAGPGLLG